MRSHVAPQVWRGWAGGLVPSCPPCNCRANLRGAWSDSTTLSSTEIWCSSANRSGESSTCSVRVDDLQVGCATSPPRSRPVVMIRGTGVEAATSSNNFPEWLQRRP